MGSQREWYRGEYLSSDHWQGKRREVFATHHRHCAVCRANNVPLDVHHQTYAHLGDERPEDLILLCRSCHDEVHAYRRKNPHIALRRAVKRVRMKRYAR